MGGQCQNRCCQCWREEPAFLRSFDRFRRQPFPARPGQAGSPPCCYIFPPFSSCGEDLAFEALASSHLAACEVGYSASSCSLPSSALMEGSSRARGARSVSTKGYLAPAEGKLF